MIKTQKKALTVKVDHLPWKRMRANAFNRQWFYLLHVLGLVLILSGCATPISTRAIGVKQTYAQINLNAIKADAYSDASAQVLNRFFLVERFMRDPDKTIEVLHDKACEDDRRDLLYALSELTFLK